MTTGHVPGFEWEILATGECDACNRRENPVLSAKDGFNVCEPCAMLAAWVWRQLEGAALPIAYPTTPGFVLVLIVRPREFDTVHPFDVLMVERKDEPGKWGLPGGKVEPGESPETAAVRELDEETKLTTWVPALEVLHTGFSPRARLGRVYLCRAYAGEVDEPETPVAWKPWPPEEHAGHLAGFYVGVGEAFMARWKLQRTAASTTALSQWMDEPGEAYLEAILDELCGGAVSRLKTSYWHAMSAEERESAEVVVAMAKKFSGWPAEPSLVPSSEEPPSGKSEEIQRSTITIPRFAPNNLRPDVAEERGGVEGDEVPEEELEPEDEDGAIVRPPLPRSPRARKGVIR